MKSISSNITSCRVCSSNRLEEIHNFGTVPLADKLAEFPGQVIPSAPLSLSYCKDCFHLQINENVHPEILFKDNYPYYSSKIPELKLHFKEYAQSINLRYDIHPGDFIMEIASNDGLLLSYLKEYTVNVLGIDPSTGPAEVANSKGIHTKCAFFNKNLAEALKSEIHSPRFIIANNVLAHVPDPQNFVDAVNILADENTTVIVEVPHQLPMIKNATFDVIFHQHFSYFSLHSFMTLWLKEGFYIHHIDPVNTQGGSLRIHLSQKCPSVTPKIVEDILREEKFHQLDQIETFKNFSKKIEQLKEQCYQFLHNAKKSNKVVVAYGAPGKAATLLNYFEIDRSFIKYIVDINPTKQGKFFPNLYLPIYPITQLYEDIPDYILILSWNYAESIMQTLSPLQLKGCQFFVIYPTLRVL